MSKRASKIYLIIAGLCFVFIYWLPLLPIVTATETHEREKYFQDNSPTLTSSVLEIYTKTSRVQCALRCNRHKDCVDVAFRADKACLLLGKPGRQGQVDEVLPGLTKFALADVDGDYSQWAAWGSCSRTCGRGTRKRSRSCTEPTPKGEGRTCVEQEFGAADETQDCKIKDCKSFGMKDQP